MKRIGFLINPIAGMGGAVGLKGTDGKVNEAILRGAIPVSIQKARDFFRSLPPHDITWVTVGGTMGEDILREYKESPVTVIHHPENPTSRKDTIDSCRKMENAGVDLILFCGGDGTARDIAGVIHTIPILGIPAGVKMFSGVFASTPFTAASIVARISDLPVQEAEVLDIDEDAYRAGILHPRLYAIVQMPYIQNYCPSGKISLHPADEKRSQQEIAEFIISLMRDDTLYLIGAGATTAAIAEKLNIPNTLLGIDAVYQKKTIQQDLSEHDILTLLDQYHTVNIIISPIGAQGFILGRGNQQISPHVLDKTGTSSLIIIATPAKLNLTKRLYFDSGNSTINEKFGNSVAVICGYAVAQRLPVYIE